MIHVTESDIGNDDRADAAEGALNEYADGRYHAGEEFWTVLGDLLSDLRHLADRYGDGRTQEDFDALAASRLNYDAEHCGDPASYADREDVPDEGVGADDEYCGAEDCGGPVESRPDPGWPIGKWQGQWSAEKGWHDGPGRSVSIEDGKLVLGPWPK